MRIAFLTIFAAVFALAGCSGGHPEEVLALPGHWWPPETPRHAGRLAPEDAGIADPLQWWAVNILDQLPATVYETQEQAKFAAEMLAETNSTRAEHGLAPVKADALLNRVAQAHARDQCIRDYWSHDTPEGLDITERLLAAGVPPGFRGGENSQAYPAMPLPIQPVIDWEHHEGHRELLLDPDVEFMGAGVYRYGDESVRCVQVLLHFAASSP